MNVPKLRFPEFEGEWSQRRLEQLATVARGKFSARPRNDPQFFGGDIPFVQTGDVVNAERYLTSYTQTLNRAGVGVSKVFPAGTILITIAANIGDVAILAFPVACPDSLVGIIASKDTSVGFLYEYLGTRKDELYSYATQNAQANINLQVLAPLNVPVPTLPEQKKIAAFLGVVDAKIAALRARRDGLERYKRGLMQALFSQTYRFTKPDGTAFPDWESKLFSDIAGLSKERMNPTATSERPPVVELENLESGLGAIVGLSDLEGQLSQKTRFKSGEVLFGKLRPYLRKFARPDFDGVCSSEIWVLRGKKVSNSFLFYLIQGSQFNQLANISAGSKMPRSDWKTIADSEFEIPHPDEQQKIADALSAMDAKIAAVADQMAQMETFKKGLLQQMFV